MRFFKKLKNSASKNKKEELQEQEPEKKVGTVSIKNNIITVTNPVNCEEYASIVIPKNEQLTVTIDGEEKLGKVELTEEMKIVVSVKNDLIKEPSTSIKSIVSSDKLEVILKKEVTKGERIQLKDTSPTKEIELELVRNEFLPEPVPVDFLKLQIEEFKGTIDEEAIKKVSESEADIEEIVLRGTPPKDGVPAYYKKIIQVSEINFVQKEELIAEFIEEVPGVEGVDVFGEPIPVVVESNLPHLGEGIVERNGTLFSSRDGRLIFSDSEIDIYPQLLIPRDLKEKDGEIIFDDGDIIIQGSILEKCFIKAKGMVIVEGGVHHSTIFTQHGVQIKGNASKSYIYSGWVLFYKKIVSDILDSVLSLERSYEHISEKYKNEKDKRDELIETMIKQKYHEIMNQIEEARTHIIEQTEKFNKPYLKIFEYIDDNWNRKRFTPTKSKIEELKSVLEEYLSFLNKEIWNEPAHLTTMSISMSEIYASGNITVNGTGVYQSNIICDGNLLVREKVTGGKITANKRIEIGEYKSFNTNDYYLKTTDKDSFIKVSILHPDSLLICSEFEHINFEMQKNVYFRAKDERKKRQEQDKKKYIQNKNKE